MNPTPVFDTKKRHWIVPPLVAYWLLIAANPARASFLQGETLDAVANGIAWFALILVPIVGVTVFLMVHVLPEKIAHNRNHPQLGAIKCLCLLSLVFGGLLWPIAWLWAYTKPVLHKVAYGTDKDETHGSHGDKPAEASSTEHEIKRLREQVAQLENKLAAKKTKGGKA